MISGAVSLAGGTGVDGVLVDLFEAAADGSRAGYLRSATTSVDGAYRFDVLAGCYVLVFVAPGVSSDSPLVWQATGSLFQQVQVCVESEQTLVDVDASLIDPSAPGQDGISGRVTLVGGVGVLGVVVDLFEATADGTRAGYLRSATTQDDGAYFLPTEPGCYVLTFIAPSDAAWNTTQTQFLQVGACVEEGATLVGVDAVLADSTVPPPASVTGVIRFDDGTAVAGAVVDLFDTTADGARAGYLRSTASDEQGDYAFGVEPGCYVLVFIAPEGEAWNVSENQFLEIPFCIETGEEVRILPTLITEAGARAQLDGTVIDTNEQPVAGILVEVLDLGGTQVLGLAVTDDNGQYQIDDLPVTAASVRFTGPEDLTFTESGLPVWLIEVVTFLPLREVRTIDAVVVRPVPALVSGRVVDETGAPVAGVVVRVYTGGVFSFDSPPDPVIDLGETTTATDGTFEIPVVVSELTCDVTVGFLPGSGRSVALDPRDRFSDTSPSSFLPLPGQRQIDCLDEGVVVTGVDAEVSALRANLSGVVLPPEVAEEPPGDILMPQQAPIVEFSFDDGAGGVVTDLSGNNNNGTIRQVSDSGSPVSLSQDYWGDAGIAGGSLQMDGFPERSNSVVDIRTSPTLGAITDQMTAMAWVKRSTRLANMSILSHDYPSYFFGYHDSQYKVEFFTETGRQASCYVGRSESGVWTHMATTYDGREAKLFVNGVEICSRAVTGNLGINTTSDARRSAFTVAGMYSAEYRSGITDELDGEMDNFRLYDVALSPEEIQAFVSNDRPQLRVAVTPEELDGQIVTIAALHSGKCAEIEGASLVDEARAVQNDCSGTPEQSFRAERVGDLVRFRAQHSDKCLNVQFASLLLRAQIIQWPCGVASNELWSIVDAGEGTFTLRASHSSQCLNVAGALQASGTRLIQFPCVSDPLGQPSNQRWTITVVSSPPEPVPAGTVELYARNEDGTRGELVDSTLASSGPRTGFYSFWVPAPACYIVAFPPFVGPSGAFTQVEEQVCVSPGADVLDVVGIGSLAPPVVDPTPPVIATSFAGVR